LSDKQIILKLPKIADTTAVQTNSTQDALEEQVKEAEGAKKSFAKISSEYDLCQACGVYSPTDDCKSAQVGYDANGGYVSIVYGKKSLELENQQ